MQQIQKFILAVLLWSALTPFASANEVVVPSDSDYFVFQKDNVRLVAPEEYTPYLPQTFEYMSEFVRRYTKSFNWTLDEPLYLVLASGNNQVANGFATVTPNLMTVFYPSGQLMLEDFAMYSWFLALSSHETAHLFQINNKGDSSNLNRTIKPFVRNPPLILGPLGIPMFVHPNQFLPRFIVEGNAVMNESRILRGGRLQSAKIRAITYAQIKANSIDFKYLLNETLEFPFGNEKYWFGGYLSAYLVEKYGVEKTNRFFYSHGGEWFNPLVLRSSFIQHFGESYAQALTNALARFRPEANKQVSSSEAALTKGVAFSPMNHNGQKIFFLKSDELEERPKLVVYDKATGEMSQVKIDLAMGKVFKLAKENNDEWATAAAASYKATKKAYGLYGPGLKVYRDYLNKMVLDQRAGQTLTIDPVHSLLRNKVSLNNQYWGESDSLPLLDEQGHVYDFIQEGSKRVLRKNQKPLVAFTGYDSSLIEITDDGKVYFIAASPYGSSLYAWTGKEIQRLSHSDTIVDAELISDKKALVVEAVSTGFELKAIELKPEKSTPVVYSYKLNDEPIADLKTPNQELGDVKKRRYNGLLEDWRFSRLSVFAPAITAGLGSLEAEFVDPLFYHVLTLGYAHGLDNSHNAATTYRYTRHLVNLNLIAGYQEPITVNKDGKVTSHQHERVLGVGLSSAPLFQWRRWQTLAAVTGYYENEDILEKKSLVSNLQLNYSRNYPRSYAPDRYMNLHYKNKVSSALSSWKKDDAGNMGQLTTNINLGSQIFWSQTGTVALAEQSSLKLNTVPSLTGQDIEVQRLYDYSLTTTKLSAYRMGFLKAFHTPIYTTRFPVGLRRMAPYVEAQMLWLDRSRKIFEYQVGTQFETLMFQSFPLRMTLSYANDDVRREGSVQVQVALVLRGL